MRSNETNQTAATTTKAGLTHRYTGIITYRDGTEVYLDNFYKTETAARNAVIRARARLKAAGIKTLYIRVACLQTMVTGWSSPICAGVFPSDYSGTRDGRLAEYFR